jgi:hypothetical protein
MATDESREAMAERYRQEALEYCREHMDGPAPPETVSQGTQRKTTLSSLSLLKAHRSDVHYFNELLVRYPRAGQRQKGEVVPDNMVFVHDGPLDVDDVYDTAAQPARPFWVLDYTSDVWPRKSYAKSFDKYERDLKVPYVLTFETEKRELALHRHAGAKYARVKPNARDRYPLEELELEVALLDGWVRFWFRGDLLLLPAEMYRETKDRQGREDAERRTAEEVQARLVAEAETARLRAEIEQLKRRLNHH